MMTTTAKFWWPGDHAVVDGDLGELGPGLGRRRAMTTTRTPARASMPGYLVSRRHRVSRLRSVSDPFWVKTTSGSACSGSAASSRSTPACSSEGMPPKGSPGAAGRPKPPGPRRTLRPSRRPRSRRPPPVPNRAGPQRLAVGSGTLAPAADSGVTARRPARTPPPGPAPRRRAGWSPAARRGCRRPRSCCSSSRTTRSARLMVDSRWAMISVVRPSIRTRRLAWISCSTWTSMALVASSSTRIGGLTSRVRAMAMRWRWPPDKRVAPLADHRVVALGQVADELVGPGGRGRGLDLVERRRRLAVGDVVPDRDREEEGLVEHDADVGPQAGQGEVAHVVAVDLDRAVRHVVEAGQQPGHGRLARSGPPTRATVSPGLRCRSKSASTRCSASAS